jgi:hypothetical protein
VRVADSIDGVLLGDLYSGAALLDAGQSRRGEPPSAQPCEADRLDRQDDRTVDLLLVLGR